MNRYAVIWTTNGLGQAGLVIEASSERNAIEQITSQFLDEIFERGYSIKAEVVK